MQIHKLVLLLFLIVTTLVYAKTIAEWKSRTIYQLLTDRFARSTSSAHHTNQTKWDCDLGNYCGGTYRGIINKLDYITNMGFNAIWISPIVENTAGGYHGYWLKNLWTMNRQFGTEQDFKDLISECHKRNVWVMVDIVMNHVGPVDMDFGQISPFNNPDHYHVKCQVTDWLNQTQVELCRLFNLPDLNQDNALVFTELSQWTKNLITTYNVDGLRIDTVPYVSKKFWSTWKAQYVGSTLSMGEILDWRADYVAGYANIIGSTLSFPLYFALRDVFVNKRSMHGIRNVLATYKQYFSDPTGLGVFVDNHDVTRFLHDQRDWKQLQNALTYTVFAEGISIIYYGTEQAYSGGTDPNNREPLWASGYNTDAHFYKFIQTLLKFKNSLISEITINPQEERFVSDQFYGFTRGKVFVATTNVGGNYERLQVDVTNHPYHEGTVLCEIFFQGDCVTVRNGKFTVILLKGESKVFYPK